MIRWAVAGLLVFALLLDGIGAAHAQAAQLESVGLTNSALEKMAATGEEFPLALQVKIEEAWAGDGARSTFVLVNSGALSVTDVSVRVCLPAGWTWGIETGASTLPLPRPWKQAPDDHSLCRRFLLGALPGRREREFAVDLVMWPPTAEGDLEREGSPFTRVLEVSVLDVSVFAASRPDEPAELVLRRSFELRPGVWAQFGHVAAEEGAGELPADPSGVQREQVVQGAQETQEVQGVHGAQGMDGRPGGLAATVALAVESELPGQGGRAGASWNIAGDAGWGAVSAELRTARAWEDGLVSAFGGAPSLAWTSTKGAARIGSQSNAVEFDWHWGPAKVVSLSGVRPTLAAAAAWSAGARASAETTAGGVVSGRLGTGWAAGDIWSCRMAEAALGWEGNGAGAALSFAEVVNTSVNTKGPQQRRAALAQLETSSQVSLGEREWSVRGVLVRGVPRTLIPSCGLSPKEGWRLRLLAESGEPSLLEGVSWTAAWPIEARPDRPFTHEFAAALSFRVTPQVSLEAEPALRFAAGGEAALALRTQAGVGPLHRLRFEFGPEALTPASELPRAGEGVGRVLAGWEVPRGPVRPRLTYESERVPGGRQDELRSGLTLIGSVRVPWGDGGERVEGSVRLAREHSWGAKGERYENLIALRLGRRPSTARAEWTWTESQRRASFTVEYEPGNTAAVERVQLSAEQVVKGAGPFRRLEGTVEGRWARGRWGGALAHATSPAVADPGGPEDAGEPDDAEEPEDPAGAADAGGDGDVGGAVDIAAAGETGAFGGTGGAAMRAFVTWDLGRWQLKGEWAESAHTQDPPGFARRVELQVKRWIGEAISLAATGGLCWGGSSSESAGHGPAGCGLETHAPGPLPCPPRVALEWHPPLGGREAVVALQVEFPAGKARVGLSMSAPLAW